MASINIKSQISFNDLLKGIEQLSSSDLDALVQKVLSVRATKSTSSQEAELLKQIQAEFPERKRMYELIEKQKEEIISGEERMELEKLIDQSEKLHIQRVLAIGRLAKIRNTTVEELVEKLDLKSF